jgi:hypothetical protein
MRILKITATFLATSLMVGMVALPKTSFSVERALRQQGQQHQQVVAGHQAAHAALNLTMLAFSNPLAALNAPAAPGNLTQALTTAVGAAGSAVHGQPIATVPDKLTVMHNIEVAAMAGANPATITAKEDIRKALGLAHDNPALAGASPESLAVISFINSARADHILDQIHTKMAAGTVDQIRQHIAAPGGAGAGGQIPHVVFPPNPTPDQILKAFVRDINISLHEAHGNGVNPNGGQMDAWLAQFDVP